jgi:hypothetical protein
LHPDQDNARPWRIAAGTAKPTVARSFEINKPMGGVFKLNERALKTVIVPDVQQVGTHIVNFHQGSNMLIIFQIQLQKKLGLAP